MPHAEGLDMLKDAPWSYARNHYDPNKPYFYGNVIWIDGKRTAWVIPSPMHSFNLYLERNKEPDFRYNHIGTTGYDSGPEFYEFLWTF